MSHEILLRQLELGSTDVPFVVVGVIKTTGPTAIKAGNKAIILSDGTIEGWVGGHCTENEIVENALECLREGTSRSLNLTTCQGGRMDVYMEPYLPKRRLVIFGHVPIVSSLSRLARSLNFSVTIVDKSASKERFPDADVVLGSFEELDKLNPSQTFAVVATMGERDQEYAQRLSKLVIPYIGVVAGKKRASEVLSYLRAAGLTEAEISRVKSPAGIYIRAVTAEEIALSIMSEIIDHSRTNLDRDAIPLTIPDGPGRDQSMKKVDPVCGMVVDAASAENFADFRGEMVYFCSESCKNAFVRDPEKYILEKNTAKV
jgi:xanthine dehydrogenase accessory factor